ncbi:hypothetical protein N2152v2_000032 [Parachlorella kessleri]
MAPSPQLFTPEQLAFCQALPKVELHAHLNGSIRDSTIRELAAAKLQGNNGALSLEEVEQLTQQATRSLAECFRLFDVIHRITTDLATITRITAEVLEDFAAENVVYLELRTTPKARPEYGMTKQSYLGAVLAGVQRWQAAQGSAAMLVRLLLSIDRRQSTEEALDTVRLAVSLRDRGVVGIDLSGNPTAGEWGTWLPALDLARSQGLKVTLHAGEVPNAAETRAMLAWGPDRVGHMCCLDEELEQQLLGSNIPLELCLSSNVITESVKSYQDHHFAAFHGSGHPVVLCTDDSGVFATSLSREYAIAAAAFGISGEELAALALRGVDYTFLEEGEKAALRGAMRARVETLLRS